MTIQELHTSAIELADHAFIEKFNERNEQAIKLFEEAFILEKNAAFLAKEQNVGEPSISILFKSASSLAINANLLEEAEKLICFALSGCPPFDIAEELRNLLEELYFQRHLQLQGIQLNPTELQFVIAGRGIGYGMAKSDLIFDKLSTLEKLTLRTAERISGRKFRSKGDVSKLIKMNFQPYMSVPRAASFAFTIRIGAPSQQQVFEGFENSIEIIEDLIDNINLVNCGAFKELETRIVDKTYLKNFISLSKELAPDGNEINLVGLSIIKNNEKKVTYFTSKTNRMKTVYAVSCLMTELLIDGEKRRMEDGNRFMPVFDDLAEAEKCANGIFEIIEIEIPEGDEPNNETGDLVTNKQYKQ